jgi:hypothetical protein
MDDFFYKLMILLLTYIILSSINEKNDSFMTIYCMNIIINKVIEDY